MIGSVSQNQTIKIGSVVTMTWGGFGPPTASYTVPANSYLLLTRVNLSAAFQITFPSNDVKSFGAGVTEWAGGFMVPAGSQLNGSGGGFGATGSVDGVLFTNSP